MAMPKRRQVPQDPDLTTPSDFQLLNDLATLVGSPSAVQLKVVVRGIIHRYTSHLEASSKPDLKWYNSKLGDARCGDAKRVEQIIGINRGELLRLAEESAVKGCSFESEQTHGETFNTTRAKRLYCLVSIAEHFEQKAALNARESQ